MLRNIRTACSDIIFTSGVNAFIYIFRIQTFPRTYKYTQSIILNHRCTIYQWYFISSPIKVLYMYIRRQNPINMSNILDCRHLLTDCNILDEWMLADMQRPVLLCVYLNYLCMYVDILIMLGW